MLAIGSTYVAHVWMWDWTSSIIWTWFFFSLVEYRCFLLVPPISLVFFFLAPWKLEFGCNFLRTNYGQRKRSTGNNKIKKKYPKTRRKTQWTFSALCNYGCTHTHTLTRIGWKLAFRSHSIHFWFFFRSSRWMGALATWTIVVIVHVCEMCVRALVLSNVLLQLFNTFGKVIQKSLRCKKFRFFFTPVRVHFG